MRNLKFSAKKKNNSHQKEFPTEIDKTLVKLFKTLTKSFENHCKSFKTFVNLSKTLINSF